MEIKDHIDNSLKDIRDIFERASKKIEALPKDTRLPLTKLTKELSLELGTSEMALYHILKYLVNTDYPGIKISRGSKGGILRL